MIYLQLFWEFFKTGLFAIGGGNATIPFLYSISDNYGWFTNAELANMIAVSESTPGAIGVNMSTYCGYQTAGILGGIIATFGLILPSIIIIVIISRFLQKFRSSKIVDDAFYGIRPCSTALISIACYFLLQLTIFHFNDFFKDYDFSKLINYKGLILGSVLLFLILKFKKHPIIYIFASAVIGIVFQFSV